MTKNLPKVNIIEELFQREATSPDFYKLRQYDWIPVFIYDNMKREGTMNKQLQGAKYLGEAHTATNRYYMEQTHHARNTILFPEDNPKSLRKAKVKGELYALPPEALLSIDKYQQNGYMYTRELRNFFLEDQSYTLQNKKLRTPSIRAWVYFGNETYWKKLSLKSCQMFTHRTNKHLKDFYEYRAFRLPYTVNGKSENWEDFWPYG